MHGEKNRHPYEDILYMPRPVSDRHPPIPMIDRGAQFAPFDALTGYGSAIRETARLTEQRVELTEGEIEVLNEKLRKIADCLLEPVEISATWFCPDERKDGGAYITMSGKVHKVDSCRNALVMADGTAIPFESLCEIVLPSDIERNTLENESIY